MVTCVFRIFFFGTLVVEVLELETESWSQKQLEELERSDRVGIFSTCSCHVTHFTKSFFFILFTACVRERDSLGKEQGKENKDFEKLLYKKIQRFS